MNKYILVTLTLSNDYTSWNTTFKFLVSVFFLAIAFKTEVVFTCSNWKTEGVRDHTNNEWDSQQLSELTYYFYYYVRGRPNIKYYVETVVAVKGVTKAITLRPGLREKSYFIDVYVRIKDRFDSVAIHKTLSLQVGELIRYFCLYLLCYALW